MPTGYTEAVQSGKVTEFDDFVWICARGMGALVMMRDEPWGAPIPERFEPSLSYYDEAIAKAKGRLVELNEMSPAAAREAAQQAYAADLKAADDYEADKAVKRARYVDMLTKVEAWDPPTQDHVGLQEFMSEQLRRSIDFDCEPGGFWKPLKKQEPAEWHAAEVKEAMRSLEHHTAEREKEITRTEGRNRWLAQLRASLTKTEA